MTDTTLSFAIDLDPDAFDRAADYLLVHGHCKYSWQNNLGQVCLMGALDQANLGLNSIRYLAAIDQVLGLRPDYGQVDDNGILRDNYRGIPCVYWNNEPERTPGEVIDALITTGKAVRAAQERWGEGES